MAEIPTHAKRVFKGILYDVYHFEQEMFDGTTKTFEMLHRKPSVQVLPIYNGKVVVAKEQQPGTETFATFLGGCSEEGEDPLHAAKRELLEETGFHSDAWELLFTLPIPGRINWDIHFYVARDCKKVAEQNLDNGEKIELIELDFEELIQFTQQPGFRNKVFKSYMANFQYDQEKLALLKGKLFPDL